MIEDAAAKVIAVADDSGMSLIDVIAEMERYIVQETKVGDAGDGSQVPPGRRGYTLIDGRLVEVGPAAGRPPEIIDCGQKQC
jgi:S-adenosylhomocysteine hydrolase